MESFLFAGFALLAQACGYIGYDELGAPCRDTDCESGRDPAQGDGDDDGDRGGDGDGSVGDGDADGTDGDDSDGDGTDGDGADDDSDDGSELGCGSMLLLHESFDDGQASVGWVERWYDGASLRLANDRLEMDLSGAADAEATYRTSQVYDLRDSELAVEMKPGGQITGLALREGALEHVDYPVSPQRGGVEFSFVRGELNAYLLGAGNAQLGASGRYDAEAHRYLRIRESAGTIHWETSPDRGAWTELWSRATPMDASAVRVELFAHGRADDNLAWFDDLNVPVTEVSSACPPTRLGDDFDDGSIALVWKRWFGAGSCSVEERAGQVELALTGNAFATCGLVSSSHLDFRDASISFALDPGSQSTSVAAFADLSHYRPAGVTDRIEVRVVDERVRMRIMHKPSPEQSELPSFSAEAAYEADGMRYFRLRESSGRIYWECSPDRVNWSMLAESATTIDVSAVIFGLSAVKVQGTGSAVFHYDDVGP